MDTDRTQTHTLLSDAIMPAGIKIYILLHISSASVA